MNVSAADQARVSQSIRAAELRTSGEFVCVLARSASAYEFYPLAWASLLALALPWPLVALTQWAVRDILLAQLALFLVALLVLSIPAVRLAIVPRRVLRAAAYRAATEQFFTRGLARTPNRAGVLLFVACDEHYARVLADDGAASRVGPERWREAVALLVDHARRGRHADGFVAALDHCAQHLGAALPPEPGHTGTLPDKFFVI